MRLTLKTNRNSKEQYPKLGLYGYAHEAQSERSQIHLRVERDRGLLLINAIRAIHLNPTATLMAWHILEGNPDADIVALLRRKFRVSESTAKTDLSKLRMQIEQLIQPDGACPIHDLELDLIPPFSETPSAPYRMDLALTYRCNADCPHCYNARPRDYPELTTAQWNQVIDLLWDIGVPHICFTGGESTLRRDLSDLIAHADAKGQITGLLTNGIKLSDRNYVEELVSAGLDHVQITIESHLAEEHNRMVGTHGAWEKTVQGIRNALDCGLYTMTNTTLLANNTPFLADTIDFLADLGVLTIGCNALIHSGRGKNVGSGIPEVDLAPLLEIVRARTQHHGQRLIWYTPTQYCHFDPVQMELGIKACSAARYNMCIESDGAVIPCQSYYQPVGNILQDPWDAIWNHDLSHWLRERGYIPEECSDCPTLKECGGGCPLTLTHQSQQVPMNQVPIPDNLFET